MTNKLHFSWPSIEPLLEEVRSATNARTLYDQVTGKGLWLVGDDGVYFMPNTTDGIHHKPKQKDEPRLLAYAEECDPTRLPFETWWANKASTFGGDDGVDFFPLADIEVFEKDLKPKLLVAEFSKTQIVLSALY